MNAIVKIPQPQELPFLKAVCWDLVDISVLNDDEKLDRYERFWNYKGVLEDIDKEELLYINWLAKTKGSWLQTCV